MLSASSELPGAIRPSRRRRRRAGALDTALVLHLFPAIAGSATAPAQRHSGLGQDPVDEAVGSSCRSRQGTNALSRVISFTEACRQLAAIHSGHPRAFLEGLGHHMYLLLALVISELHVPLGNDQA